MADEPANGPFVEPTELAELEHSIGSVGQDDAEPGDEPFDENAEPVVRPADQSGAEDDPDVDQGLGVREPEGETS